MNNGKIQAVVRKLPVQLTEAEKSRMGEQMAHLRNEVEPLKEQRKEINEEIRVRNDSILTIARAIEAGVEDRDVRCIPEADWKANTVRLVREDTGEEVPGSKRALTAEERQASLFDVNQWLTDEDERNSKAAEAAEKMRRDKAAKKGGKAAKKGAKKKGAEDDEAQAE